jgi:hypothetical protein
MNRFLILVMFVVAAALAHAQDIAGDWQGTLSAGGQDLRLVLHITTAPTADSKPRWTASTSPEPTASPSVLSLSTTPSWIWA